MPQQALAIKGSSSAGSTVKQVLDTAYTLATQYGKVRAPTGGARAGCTHRNAAAAAANGSSACCLLRPHAQPRGMHHTAASITQLWQLMCLAIAPEVAQTRPRWSHPLLVAAAVLLCHSHCRCPRSPPTTLAASWQPIVHWGFIPAIIVAGMLFTKPRPTLAQLLLLG
jgi:hypothetical protein